MTEITSMKPIDQPSIGASPLPFPPDAAKVLELTRDVVDWLLPLLKPYEAAYYVHCFRHSWLTTGQPLVRLTYRWLKTEVVKTMLMSAQRHDYAVCASTIRQTLGALAALGAIRREEPPTSLGTVYRVFVPDEIEACRRRRADKAKFTLQRAADFYNVRENRRKIFERDDYTCRYCQQKLTPHTVTLDHVIPVIAGGNNSLENLVTACVGCNSRKNGKSIADFLADQNPTARGTECG